MTGFVADVGGTNTRVALVGSDGRAGPSRRFRNDRFETFADLLTAWIVSDGVPALRAACIAIAGPVTARQARLTNRDWSFDRAAIAARLELRGPAQVLLINDLAALGHALAALEPAQVETVRAASVDLPANDQALVAGLGTGFNIALAKLGTAPQVVIEAELGHASLPSSIRAALAGVIGDGADRFGTFESLFSGRGLARLHRGLGGNGRDAAELIAGYDLDRPGTVTRAVNLAARAMGLLARELVMLYQPHAGLHFAGGVARGLLGSPARAVFLDALSAPGPFADQVAQVPVRLVTDDAAGLAGAARLVHALAARVQ